MICRGLCACAEMLCICVLYVSCFQAVTLCRYGCMYFLVTLVFVCVNVMVNACA